MKDMHVKYQFGFISPTGEFIACDICDHEDKAVKFCESLNIDPYDEQTWGWDCCATDVLIKQGWILIHGINELEIEIPENRPITEDQRLRLAVWFNLHSEKYGNILKDCSQETIKNLEKVFEDK